MPAFLLSQSFFSSQLECRFNPWLLQKGNFHTIVGKTEPDPRTNKPTGRFGKARKGTLGQWYARSARSGLMMPAESSRPRERLTGWA